VSNSTRSGSTAPAAGYIQPILLDSDLENLVIARRWLKWVMADAGLSAGDAGDLMVAVGEAVTNCIKHAYRGRPGGKILISHSMDTEWLTIHVRDWGDTFATESYRAPDLDEAREGGYGIYLMQRTSDRVEIRTDRPPGTEVSLSKRLRRGKGGRKG
jgi:serine/threonine-protein kinase RsbW